MEHPDRPTEAQILAWLRLYDPEGRRPGPAREISASLPRLARILWLRYCAEPPLSLRAIAAEFGVSLAVAENRARRGLSLLAGAEEQGALRAPWDPDSPLGRAITLQRLRRRRFVPRARP
jgi:hypothetical protein